jgi:uncharacterized protein YndB with AHSA1/START domain
MAAAAQTKPLAERELTITGVFDAPRELVFKAWTDAKHLAQWWGPKGFTTPVCEFDARVGGMLRMHMRAPDGTVYPMKGQIRELVAPSGWCSQASRSMRQEDICSKALRQ